MTNKKANLQGIVMELGKPISTNDGDIVIDRSVVEKAISQNRVIPFREDWEDEKPVGIVRLKIEDDKVIADIEVSEGAGLPEIPFSIGPSLKVNAEDIEEVDGVQHIKRAVFQAFSIVVKKDD